MPKILITHFSGILVNGEYQSSVFYDGLIESLLQYGNDVMQLMTSDFVADPWNGENKATSEIIKQKVLTQIKDFQPDLIISFNNSSIEGIEQLVACPIILWDADSAPFFCAKDQIKSNLDRYKFFSFSTFGLTHYQEFFGVKASETYLVPAATGIRSEKMDKQYNISFIGNPFFNSSNLVQAIVEFPDIYVVKNFDHNHDLKNKLNKHNVKISELQHMASGSQRTRMIMYLTELGCDIFGPISWLDLAPYLIEIAACYHKQLVYSMKHNALIYNRSKVALNVSHTQNITGYPWRVLDILASDSVLLSDYKSDLSSHFGSKINLQIYDSPTEAYSKAKKLIQDDALRADIIAQSNAAIEENFRWQHRFDIIRQATGVNLANNPDGINLGKYTRLQIELPAEKEIQIVCKLFDRSRRRKPVPNQITLASNVTVTHKAWNRHAMPRLMRLYDYLKFVNQKYYRNKIKSFAEIT